jgi:hypothetical protein
VGRRPVERLLRSAFIVVAGQHEAGARNQDTQHEHEGGGEMAPKKQICSLVRDQDKDPSGLKGFSQTRRKLAEYAPSGIAEAVYAKPRERAFEAVRSQVDCCCGVFYVHCGAHPADRPESCHWRC